MIDNGNLQEKIEIPLIEEILDIPIKNVVYKGETIEVKKLLETIYGIFYSNKGVPVSTREITDSFGFQRAEKFVDKVIIPHLYPNTKNGLVKSFKNERKYFFYPIALILKPKKNEILDFTSNTLFYSNVNEISEILKVNICNPSDTLSNFLKSYHNRDYLNVIKILLDIAKDDSPNYDKEELKALVNRRLLEAKINEKTAEALYNIGNLKLQFVMWFGTGKRGEEFTCTDISCKYIDKPLIFSEKMKIFIQKKIDEKRKEADEIGEAFDNNPGYRLLKIAPTRPFSSESHTRKLKLHLTFSPTDFYTSAATNQSVDEIFDFDNWHTIISLRDKFVKNQDLSDPTYLLNSKLANMFGIALATITKDNKILLQKRSKQVHMKQTGISLTTAENMVRDSDIDENKNPSFFITAQRCLREEVGVEIQKEDCVFLGLGVRIDNLLPQALGMIKLKKNSDELNFMNARDRWEGYNFVEDFSFESLKQYFDESNLMSATAQLTILLALINQYSFEAIERQVKEMQNPKF